MSVWAIARAQLALAACGFLRQLDLEAHADSRLIGSLTALIKLRLSPRTHRDEPLQMLTLVSRYVSSAECAPAKAGFSAAVLARTIWPSQLACSYVSVI